jgi:hypothetical protein
MSSCRFTLMAVLILTLGCGGGHPCDYRAQLLRKL